MVNRYIITQAKPKHDTGRKPDVGVCASNSEHSCTKRGYLSSNFLGQRVNVNFGHSGGYPRIRRSDPDVCLSACLPVIFSIVGTSIKTSSTIMPTPRKLVPESRLEVCSTQ